MAELNEMKNDARVLRDAMRLVADANTELARCVTELSAKYRAPYSNDGVQTMNWFRDQIFKQEIMWDDPTPTSTKPPPNFGASMNIR